MSLATDFGLIPALGGEVRPDGHPLARLSRAEIVRRIAYVPQSHAPPFAYAAFEIVLMDEPTASLDVGNQAAVLAETSNLVRSAGAEGRGVILSTHDSDQAYALGAEVLLMRDGRVVGRGAPEVAQTGESLSAVYGVPVTVERTESGRLVCAPTMAR